MSEDKEKLDMLAEKIEELLSILKDVSEDLKTVSASLKSLAVSPLNPPRQRLRKFPRLHLKSRHLRLDL